MNGDNRHLEQELDRLLAAYRDACEAPEPGPEFLPRLWERIDSTQGWTERLWKWANGLAAAAAAASVLLVILQLAGQPRQDFYSATYVETLMAQTEAELAPADVAGIVPDLPMEPPER